MKRVLFFMCCLAISLHIFSQEQLSKELFPTLAGLERTMYNHHCGSSKPYANREMPNEIDTIIKGKAYVFFDNFFLREENNQVLVYSSFYEKDLVLYDWTLEVGDSLQNLRYIICESSNYIVTDFKPYHDLLCNGIENEKRVPVEKIVVTKVSTVTLLDGKEYKKWTFNSGFEYIEGIGCVANGLHGYNLSKYTALIIPWALPTCIYEDFLVCVSRDGELLYKMDDETQKQFGSKCKCLNKGASAIYYKPMVVEGYNWNVVNRNASMDDNDSVKYKTIKQKFEGDSIINDVTYKKLWQSTDDELADYELIGLIREDAETEKVWAYVGDKEYLVYDFACSVGDKVTTLKSLQSAKNQIEEVELTIKAIEVIEDLNGTKYNKYIATLDNESEIVYYERFGSENGWYSRSYDGITGGGVNFMVCAFDDANELLFKPVHNNELDEIENCYINETKTDVETITAPTTTAVQKIIRDGQVFIIRDGKTYNIMGVEVKNIE